MGISRHPHGIYATPLIGAETRASMWAADNVFFVDGDNGSSSNDGRSPSSPVALVSTAVGLLSARGGVIYVRPRSTAASAQTYYVDNVTIPLTATGLSIIGTGANPSRPFMGVAIKASTTTSALIDVLASDVHIEGMRLTGTGQNATDGIAVIKAFASATSNGSVGLQVVACRLDNGKTGGAVSFDSPNHAEILDCSFDECAVGVTTVLSYGGVASRGLKILGCDFGGRNSTRDMDVYISQSGTGVGNSVAGYEIRDCRFLDELPAKGSNNRFIKIANGDMGLISNCVFPVDPGANHIATFGAAGNQCVIPTTWKVVACRGSNDLDFIHPEAA